MAEGFGSKNTNENDDDAPVKWGEVSKFFRQDFIHELEACMRQGVRSEIVEGQSRLLKSNELAIEHMKDEARTVLLEYYAKVTKQSNEINDLVVVANESLTGCKAALTACKVALAACGLLLVAGFVLMYNLYKISIVNGVL
ncbi:TPA: hypothetical protein L5T32_004206 [Pseudomonas aeruginosa]|nr:hypothetical protein [Pseudomonas aeruginosa]